MSRLRAALHRWIGLRTAVSVTAAGMVWFELGSFIGLHIWVIRCPTSPTADQILPLVLATAIALAAQGWRRGALVWLIVVAATFATMLGNTGKTQGTAAFFVWCDAPEYDSSYA
jgi:hypothetical protein